MPGRCPNSIMCRYENIENPNLKRDFERPAVRGPGSKRALPWSAQEDKTLLEAIDKYGAGNWCIIRKELTGRTMNECWHRFQRLNPDNKADMYDVLLATKDRMLPPNSYHTRFAAGRLGEARNGKRPRSELVASDFKLRLLAHPATAGRGARVEREEDDGSGDGGDDPAMVFTTNNPRIDKHLRRVNTRRRQEARASAAARTLKDKELDAPIALGGGLSSEPSRSLQGGPSQRSGRLSKQLKRERSNRDAKPGS